MTCFPRDLLCNSPSNPDLLLRAIGKEWKNVPPNRLLRQFVLLPGDQESPLTVASNPGSITGGQCRELNFIQLCVIDALRRTAISSTRFQVIQGDSAESSVHESVSIIDVEQASEKKSTRSRFDELRSTWNRLSTSEALAWHSCRSKHKEAPGTFH